MASNEEALSVTEQNDTRKAEDESGEQRDNPTTQADQNNTQVSRNASSENKLDESYAKSYLRVSKDDLYMTIALWMEDFVDKPPVPTDEFGEAPEPYSRKVGAVLVLPNDVVLAADCSRDGVHAVARLLIKHHNKAEGCKMFMSRKPCPMCAKLLVQSKVKRVLYLPFEPEYYRSPETGSETETDKNTETPNNQITQYNDEQMKQVDIMFTASAIAQTKFVLRVEEPVLELVKKKSPPEEENNIEEYKTRLINKYGFKETSEWMKAIKKKLPWKVFDDKIKEQVRNNFEEVMEWIARVLVVRSGKGLNYKFEPCNEKSKNSESFNPTNNHDDEKQARHFIEIARFLAERTDDPKTGVGAVIVNAEMEILSFGWNGFPLKAHYGEFARASKSDESDDKKPDKKYPYVIHAEQNALLMRNNRNIEGAILFVTKSPCNECAPLIAMEGIKTVVADDDVLSRKETTQKDALDYNMFLKMIKKGKFVCYQTKKKPADPKDIPAEKGTKRKLEYPNEAADI